MGRATRWLKSLLGGGAKKEGTGEPTRKEQPSADAPPREKKRWSFSKPPKDGEGGRGAAVPVDHGGVAPVDAAWLRNYYAQRDKEHSKHAIAVAAATAAAADAAVAAAQAAVEVVRLTSQGTGALFPLNGGGPDRQLWAAVRIQTAFRGYLAKKALRALKALVKLQALVRGYLVRKQAAATLHSMQALIRAQAAVRMQRASRATTTRHSADAIVRPRRSAPERFDESRSAASSFHSRRLSATLDHHTFTCSDVDSPKIVEVDPGRPKSSPSSIPRRAPRGGGLHTSSDSSTTESTMTPPPSHSSPLLQTTSLIPVTTGGFHEPEWCLTGDECRFSTAQSTPRLAPAVPFSGVLLPPTPSKSICGPGEYYFQSHYHHSHNPAGHHPNYMANTQSFTAKVRSQSAPKQRPDPRGRTLQHHQRMSLSEAVARSRTSLTGVKMHRNCSHAQEAVSFKNATPGRLVERSSDLAATGGDIVMTAYDRDNSYYYSATLQRRW